MTVVLYPAIELRGGQVVRLLQGDYAQETVYGDDPVAVALSFVEAGATWIHIVDLDAARTGEAINRRVVAAVARAVGDRAAVQTGGGVRSLSDAQALSDAGVARVVMGSAAVADPTLVEEAAKIVGFFQKDDEIKSIAKKIKRALLDQGFDDPELVKAVKERFMELGKRHFK